MKNIQIPGLANSFFFTLDSVSLSLSKIHKPLLEELGITYAQYLIMLLVQEKDGITATEMSLHLGQSRPALSPMIKKLESQNLICRYRDPQDKRRVCIKLTDRSNSVLREAELIPGEALRACGLDSQAVYELKSQIDAICQSLCSPRKTCIIPSRE
ncbi:MarR family winged helix-turn-helix transcriptional regulator [Microbulbifer epialgicus]|uniref:MarR family winged helix-turn-helix transcriptional regulator n=1 Tax=Microbulbifer epialgicus TaxID=393907 RepID=A0ABV4P608_9GAMM